MIGALDPHHDRCSELLTSSPGTPVQHVLLQQGKERFHRRVITSSTHASHRPLQSVAGHARRNFRDRNWDPRSLCTTHPATSPRLAAAFSSAATASRDFIRSLIEYPRSGSSRHLSPHTSRLALTSWVLGDIRQPERIHRLGTELALDEIIMHGRSWPVVLPASSPLPEHTPPAPLSTDPPRGPVRHRLACLPGFVGEEPMPELRVIQVRVVERVRPIRPGKFSFTDGLSEPPIVRLASRAVIPDTTPSRESRHRRAHSTSGYIILPAMRRRQNTRPHAATPRLLARGSRFRLRNSRIPCAHPS